MESHFDYLNRITHADCFDHLSLLPDHSIHSLISDIPYGINLDDWDVLHPNTNSALLGQSPAQIGKGGFKRRGKPIRGWNRADRKIPQLYQEWCSRWAQLVYPKMVEGSSLFIFGARRTLHRAIIALEDCGFLLRDVLAWQKPSAHHRAQHLSEILEKRGLHTHAQRWRGWRLGNLAPRWEPIAWMFKPYRHTLTDAVLQNGVGAVNVAACLVDGKMPSNVLNFWYEPNEVRVHEAQKPVKLVEFLIKLTTLEGHIVLDPFMGSGTTAVACKRLNRHYIGFEINQEFVQMASQRLDNWGQ